MNINVHSYVFNELLEGTCDVIGLTYKEEHSRLKIGDTLGVSSGLEGTIVEFKIVNIGIFDRVHFESSTFSTEEWLDIIPQSGNIQSYGKQVKMIGVRVVRIF